MKTWIRNQASGDDTDVKTLENLARGFAISIQPSVEYDTYVRAGFAVGLKDGSVGGVDGGWTNRSDADFLLKVNGINTGRVCSIKRRKLCCTLVGSNSVAILMQFMVWGP